MVLTVSSCGPICVFPRPSLSLEVSYLLLSQGIVFEGLYGLFRVYLARENIVQAKLSRENVHQNVHCMFRILKVRKSIENIYHNHELRPDDVNRTTLRMCRSPNLTSPFAFSAPRAYNIRLRTNVMFPGECKLILADRCLDKAHAAVPESETLFRLFDGVVEGF